MKRLIRHIKKWRKWSKHNGNRWEHKLLVLLGSKRSPTFELMMTDEEEEEQHQAFLKMLQEAMQDAETSPGWPTEEDVKEIISRSLVKAEESGTSGDS